MVDSFPLLLLLVYKDGQKEDLLFPHSVALYIFVIIITTDSDNHLGHR